MGFADLDDGEVTRRSSASETARFGFTTDRLTVGLAALERWGSVERVADEVVRHLDESEASTVILRYPSELVGIARSVSGRGRDAHPAGSLLYWESPREPAEPDPSVREVLAADRPAQAEAIRAVLADSFRGYINHYAANPAIAPEVAAVGYAEWASTTMADVGNRVFVVSDDAGLVGVAVLAVVRGVWEVELAGVIARAQGRGHYLALMRQVQSAAAAADRLLISTQSHNIGVQRAWAKLGMRPIASIDTVHLVRP